MLYGKLKPSPAGLNGGPYSVKDAENHRRDVESRYGGGGDGYSYPVSPAGAASCGGPSATNTNEVRGRATMSYERCRDCGKTRGRRGIPDLLDSTLTCTRRADGD